MEATTITNICCNKCKKNQPESNFIGKNVRITKMCQLCRDKYKLKKHYKYNKPIKIIPPKQNNTTTMNPYSKSKVYKIVNTVNDNVYIGSTKNDLSVRFTWHMEQACAAPSKCHRHWNFIGWTNVMMILVEESCLENETQLHQREQYYIDLWKPALNSKSAYGKSIDKVGKDTKEVLIQKALIKEQRAKIKEQNKQDLLVICLKYIEKIGYNGILDKQRKPRHSYELDKKFLMEYGDELSILCDKRDIDWSTMDTTNKYDKFHMARYINDVLLKTCGVKLKKVSSKSNLYAIV